MDFAFVFALKEYKEMIINTVDDCLVSCYKFGASSNKKTVFPS